MMRVVSVVLYLLLAPFAGALLDGFDRKRPFFATKFCAFYAQIFLMLFRKESGS